MRQVAGGGGARSRAPPSPWPARAAAGGGGLLGLGAGGWLAGERRRLPRAWSAPASSRRPSSAAAVAAVRRPGTGPPAGRSARRRHVARRRRPHRPRRLRRPPAGRTGSTGTGGTAHPSTTDGAGTTRRHTDRDRARRPPAVQLADAMRPSPSDRHADQLADPRHALAVPDGHDVAASPTPSPTPTTGTPKATLVVTYTPLGDLVQGRPGVVGFAVANTRRRRVQHDHGRRSPCRPGVHVRRARRAPVRRSTGRRRRPPRVLDVAADRRLDAASAPTPARPARSTPLRPGRVDAGLPRRRRRRDQRGQRPGAGHRVGGRARPGHRQRVARGAGGRAGARGSPRPGS